MSTSAFELKSTAQKDCSRPAIPHAKTNAVFERVSRDDFLQRRRRSCWGVAQRVGEEVRSKLVQFDRPGGLDVIRLVEVPVPEAGAEQVRAKVTACGLNFSDVMIRQGRYVADVPFPYRAGREFSGVVDALGDGVLNRVRRFSA
jgi:hypothetical protein